MHINRTTIWKKKTRKIQMISSLLVLSLSLETLLLPLFAAGTLDAGSGQWKTDSTLSDNGLSANSLSDNSLSANGLSANSLSDNSLSANSLSANEIPMPTEQEMFEEALEEALAAETLAAEIEEEAPPASSLVADYRSADLAVQELTVKTFLTSNMKKPGRVTIKKVTNPSKGKIKITYKKVSGSTGYEVVYATNASFTKSKVVLTVKGTSTVISGLPTGKTYYVRVRAYKKNTEGKMVYGSYSAKKKITIKKGVTEVDAKVGRAVISKASLKNAGTLQVSAKIKSRVKSSDEYYYLFALDSYQTKLSGLKPIAKVAKKTNAAFEAALNKETANSLLQKKFVVAVKKSGKYVIISKAKYLTNPEKTAYFGYSFPVADSKKGLQINADLMTDVEELGVKNTAYNLILSDIIATSAQKNDSDGISYVYNGKKYWFSRSAVLGYDSLFLQTKEKNMVVTGILLMGWRDDLTYLIDPKGREKGHHYYMMNTRSKKARQQLEATFTFLAERYGGNGYIVNWVVGNEVNAYNDWNYAAYGSVTKAAGAYADVFRLASTSIKSMYSKARVYISLDNNWTNTMTNVYSGKQYLKAFHDALKEGGEIGFHIAFHPYSSPMTTSDFWNDTSGLVKNSQNSKLITMANLKYLTNYVKKTYGSSTRILLSETGFSSGQSEQLQAAAIAYAYYLAESNSMVDALIISRHVDNTVEVNQGLRTGLWTTNGDSAHPYEWADNKKYAWYIFKYMDTAQSEVWCDFALNYIGASSWNKLISNYKASKYRNMPDASSMEVTKPNGFYIEDERRIDLCAQTGRDTVNRSLSQNKNVLWGFRQSFDTPLDFTQNPYFGTDLTVKGTTNKKVTVKLRFHSGKNVLDAETVISTGEDTSLVVQVGAWKYASSIDKIEVLFQTADGGTWSGIASAQMDKSMTGMMPTPD